MLQPLKFPKYCVTSMKKTNKHNEEGNFASLLANPNEAHETAKARKPFFCENSFKGLPGICACEFFAENQQLTDFGCGSSEGTINEMMVTPETFLKRDLCIKLSVLCR